MAIIKKFKPFLPGLLLALFLFYTQPLQAADYINSIGKEFKNIPAGSFYMGSCKPGAACPSGGPADEYADDDETPQHKVRISKAFQLGVYEVTLGQFKKFIAGANRGDLLTGDFMKYNSHGDNAAVCWVSWNDAQDFIHWLNKKEGGNHYRLPTEAEWEYAARAGTTAIYSWGNSESRAGNYAWYYKNADDAGEGYAHSVGRKKPNPWGLYDMHGNVWEWVQDWYKENYYQNSPAADPKGPSSGLIRVYRGGSWRSFARSLRSAVRNDDLPGIRDSSIGFRLLRTP